MAHCGGLVLTRSTATSRTITLTQKHCVFKIIGIYARCCTGHHSAPGKYVRSLNSWSTNGLVEFRAKSFVYIIPGQLCRQYIKKISEIGIGIIKYEVPMYFFPTAATTLLILKHFLREI